jgi:hypothetical protein
MVGLTDDIGALSSASARIPSDVEIAVAVILGDEQMAGV